MDNILQLISPLGPLINLIFCEIVFFYCLLWSSYSNVLIPLIVAYCVAFVFLDEAPWKGGREKLLASSAFCRLFRILDYCMLTTWMKEYFPIELKKTDDLDPTMGPYLFVNHPHGVFGASHMTNFSSPR